MGNSFDRITGYTGLLRRDSQNPVYPVILSKIRNPNCLRDHVLLPFLEMDEKKKPVHTRKQFCFFFQKKESPGPALRRRPAARWSQPQAERSFRKRAKKQ